MSLFLTVPVSVPVPVPPVLSPPCRSPRQSPVVTYNLGQVAVFLEVTVVASHGTNDSYLKTKLKNSDTIPDELPVRKTIGKSLLGLMCPNPLYAKYHKAIQLLQGYKRDGCLVDCGDDC